jgi:hypothetical protein
MFFNMAVNVSDDLPELDRELKAALSVPATEETAASQLGRFGNYVGTLGERWEKRGEGRSGRPKMGSVPFFVSYFWQVQNRRVWPVYYTNSVHVMGDLNMWWPTGDLAQDYLSYKRVHEELSAAFSKAAGREFDLYWVEHVFWFKGGNPFGESKPAKPDNLATNQVTRRDERVTPRIGPDSTRQTTTSDMQSPAGAGTAVSPRLPDSYVPPIVACLDGMARNAPEMQAAAEASGIDLARAFEKYVNTAFTILGYETLLRGQGQGRVPDGQALEADHSYAILWDAKVRSGGYSMGTDDRTIKEYVTTCSRDLSRKRGFRNIYYLIVSSDFLDDFDDAVRMIKMETDVSEVCLVEAAALIEMVDNKLRFPSQVSRGPDGLQRLFSSSGIITPQDVRESLVGT